MGAEQPVRFSFSSIAKLRTRDVESLDHVVEMMGTGNTARNTHFSGILLLSRSILTPLGPLFFLNLQREGRKPVSVQLPKAEKGPSSVLGYNTEEQRL